MIIDRDKELLTVGRLKEYLKQFNDEDHIQVRNLRKNEWPENNDPFKGKKFIGEQLIIQEISLVPGWKGTKFVGLIINNENRTLTDDDILPHICVKS